MINARDDRVWARVRDFNGLPNWRPAIAESQIERAQASDKIGCVMGSTPLRARSAERTLEGRALDAPTIASAAGAALEGFSPVDEALASAWYRREVAGVHLRRLLSGEA